MPERRITPHSRPPFLLHRAVGEERKDVSEVHLKFQVWMIKQTLTSLTESVNGEVKGFVCLFAFFYGLSSEHSQSGTVGRGQGPGAQKSGLGIFSGVGD